MKNGGFTRHAFTGHVPQEGFAVSPYPQREVQIDVEAFTRQDIINYAGANTDLLAKDNHYLGGWVDGDTIYLDISIVASTRDEGLRLAIEHNQLAAWDLGRNEEVPCVA